MALNEPASMGEDSDLVRKLKYRVQDEFYEPGLIRCETAVVKHGPRATPKPAASALAPFVSRRGRRIRASRDTTSRVQPSLGHALTMKWPSCKPS